MLHLFVSVFSIPVLYISYFSKLIALLKHELALLCNIIIASVAQNCFIILFIWAFSWTLYHPTRFITAAGRGFQSEYPE